MAFSMQDYLAGRASSNPHANAMSPMRSYFAGQTSLNPYDNAKPGSVYAMDEYMKRLAQSNAQQKGKGGGFDNPYTQQGLTSGLSAYGLGNPVIMGRDQMRDQFLNKRRDW